MASAKPSTQPFERLTEEEVAFCWRSLADQGQLSVARLQQFFGEICGEELSVVQAKDLLLYMDANGDGRVGMEDFRNFMSVGRLADTDPKSFMWTPKAKYREEHGLDKLHHSEHQANEVPRPGEQLHAVSPLAELGHRVSLESLVESGHEERQPRGHGPEPPGERAPGRGSHAEPHGERVPGRGYGSEAGRSHGSEAAAERGEEERSRAPSRLLPHSQHELLNARAPSPHAPLSHAHPPQAGQRPRPSRSGRRASQLAHHRQSVVLEAPEPPAREGPPKAEAEVRQQRTPKAPPDTKTLKKIEAALERYEQVSWAGLLREETEAKRAVFTRFGAEPDAWELEAGEFHRLLTRWQGLARWAFPGDLRPGDSLATLEYFLRRDRESRGPPPGQDPAAAARAPAAAAQAAQAAEAKLPYHVWLDILGGKHRPEEHIS